MLATALRAQKHAVPRKLFPQSCQSRVSHIISDGRGAINLFKSLLHAYIAERYDVPGVPSDYDGSDSDKAENSFDKYYEKDKAGAAPGTKIYRLAGPIDRAAPTFMEYHVSASKVLGAAHQCGVSLTSYLIAAILCAIRDVMPRAPAIARFAWIFRSTCAPSSGRRPCATSTA